MACRDCIAEDGAELSDPFAIRLEEEFDERLGATLGAVRDAKEEGRDGLKPNADPRPGREGYGSLVDNTSIGKRTRHLVRWGCKVIIVDIVGSRESQIRSETGQDTSGHFE